MKRLTKLSTCGAFILIAGTNIVAAADLVISNFQPWPDNQNILSLDLDQLPDSGESGYMNATLEINGQQVTGSPSVRLWLWGAEPEIIVYPDGITSPDVDSFSSWKDWYCDQSTTPTIELTITDFRTSSSAVQTFGGGNAFVGPQTYTADLSGYTCPTTGGTPPTGVPSSGVPSTPATASASVVQSDATRVTRSAVKANNSMMSQGLERFIGDRQTIEINATGSLSFMPTLNANKDSIFAGGSFFGLTGSADNGYRQVTFGEFDLQHESGSGTTLSFNGRTAWERALNDDAMIAYFLGAEVNKSNIRGSYSGDQTRYGVTAGMYGYMALENDLYLSGYGSLGVGRSDLDITDGASTPSVITGDYSSRTASIGGKLSGSVDYDTYELRPSVGLNMVKTWIGDITLDNSGSALTSSVGNTTFAELIAKPEFIFPMEQQAGSNMIQVASAAPRLICERNDASGVVTSDCGGGVEFGIDATSEDGMTNFNASVRFDRLGSVNRQGLNLQAELRF